jgi:hypothetical protein
LPFPEHPFKWGMRFARKQPGKAPAGWLALAAALLGCATSHEPSVQVPRSSVSNASGAAESPTRRPQVPELPLGLAFTFNAGAPLGGPAGIAPDGSLLAGTTDGYLHALRPDGSFRWSYTVRGRVLGRPAWGPEGLALVSAQQNTLYAVEADGSLAWATAIPGGVTSAPVVDGDGKAWVTTGGGTLLAFGRRGGIAGFARIGQSSVFGPVLLGTGEVAVANADGTLRVAGRYGRSRTARWDGPLRELRAGGGGLFALGAGGLARFDESPLEQRWVRAEVSGIACTRPGLVTLERGAARWISAAGEPGPAVGLPPGAGTSTTCLSDGALLLASAEGLLQRLAQSGKVTDKHIPPGRVLGLDTTPAGLVIVSYADGRVVGIDAP